MILGLGTDVVEIERIARLINSQKTSFSKRILGPEEQKTFCLLEGRRLHEFVAGRFAAKEALAKAIGCGLAKLHPHQVDILLGSAGLTARFYHSDALLPVGTEVRLSLSHAAGVAFAVAILSN
ncbi:holo-ACP synthase [Alicyclobacillus tolerans]|uniref:Holo-[acyl-carrier-protein] synthase n=2 Tax=Alicyclobacillus tolerans TaxID=90970 RepID=A0A1M6N6E4_9BACL|nr:MULTISPECIES: holo-ACP synthase [Alicyclobacillus]MDP9728035.1 holo-[acyl-carrier protein] synthase [Alicyclobacillus tengchongensis]QRF24317.1 holo-[acyl-carrier-protein] synthase [Alicyclobacillus sp. TC]SHJ91270.1 holo-[acyl-carrier protein] synthase [Alicyclobacillus montanus]